ncbi:MAG: ATP-dependent zinc metalloprotease FtsH [Balneolales bacterium]|nr:ATP-dependent zinc metalloprotease FtsH [Balneolales bacterium]
MSDNKSNVPPKPKEESKYKGPRFPIWIYVAILVGLIVIQIFAFSQDHSTRVEYSEFLENVRQGYVEKVTIVNGVQIEGTFRQSAVDAGHVGRQPEETSQRWVSGSPDAGNRFTATMIQGDRIRDLLDDNDVRYDARIDENWFGSLFIWLIPIGLIILFWIFIFKRMNPGQQVLNIGKNKAALYDKQGENKVTFKDVAGLEEAKEEVEEIVEFLRSPEKFSTLGGNIPKGVLLVGPPGTGKTLMAKATAGEADVPFFSLSGSDFVEMFVGVGAARVRDLFKQAKEKAPCIIFIDEIDAIGRSRGKNAMAASNDERENTLNQLLSEMDGFNTNKGVIIMAATNRADILDSALLRPGRFDRQILIDRPDLKGREAVLKVHMTKIKTDENIDAHMLASQTPGFAGAELANMCNEAALLAARRNKKHVEMIDFQDAIERVVAGLEKKNKIISPNERRIVAYHESGHAIVGWFLEHTDPVMKVSIVPRGLAALGYTLQTPTEDRFLMTREELTDRICALLGGRVAEEIEFGRISTGAQNDLERITNMALSMVTVYGMSEKIGNVSYYDSQSEGGMFGFNKKYSEATAQLIDEEVKQIVLECHVRTKKLLLDHREKMTQMAETLLEKEILGAKDLVEMLGDRPGGRYPFKSADLKANNGNVNGASSEKSTEGENVAGSDTDVKAENESEINKDDSLQNYLEDSAAANGKEKKSSAVESVNDKPAPEEADKDTKAESNADSIKKKDSDI